jgi:transcription elongation factor Elf1
LENINFNEFEFNKTAQIAFHGQHKAEYLESVLFYCLECNSMNSLCSQGNEFFCNACGMRVRVNDTGFFEKINKAEKIPDTILEWSNKQLEYIKGFDFSGFTDKPLFRDNDVILYKAERAKKEIPLGKGTIEFFTDKLVVCGEDFLLAETTTSLVGGRKMTIYNKNDVYALMSPFGTNLLKYMVCGYYLRNKALGIIEEYYGY